MAINQTAFACILSISFLAILFLFATEIPYFQYVLKSSLFFILLATLAILFAYSSMKKVAQKETTRIKIVIIGFIMVLGVFLFTALGSRINRSYSPGTSTKIPVESISYEYSTMWGVSKQELQNLQATHLRIGFRYDGKSYSRAYKIDRIFIGEENKAEYYIVLKKGCLGFDFIQY